MRTYARFLLVGLFIVLVLLWFVQRNGFNNGFLTNQKGTYTNLSSVAAFSAHQIWSVGGILPAGAKSFQPFITSWNGTRWSRVSSPSAPGQTLSAVVAISVHDVWAVGSVIEHWNGTQWRLISHPKGSLTSVAAVAADNVWAVGTQYDRPKNYQTLIEHWNGRSWNVVRSPNGSQGDNSLASIAVVSATDIWAVGSFTQPLESDDYLLIEHWDGSRWSLAPTPAIRPAAWVSNYLASMGVISKENIWAVGGSYIPPISKYQVLLLHWNGNIWQQIPGPRLGSECCVGLSEVIAISATDIWAVGGSDTNQPLIIHWNGSTWSVVASPPLKGVVGGSLSGVAVVSADDIWAVGTADITNIDSKHIIEHWDGGAWQLVEGSS
ncbi:MAG TPA: hypothetical protein VII61_04900 [Ktedonobacteraceae bacterium]